MDDDNEMKKNSLPLFFPILISVAILLPASQTPNLFTFKPFGWDEVGQLLTFLVLISLFLERSLEVFITTWRLPDEKKIDNNIRDCKRRIEELETQRNTKRQQSKTIAKAEELGSTDSTKVETTIEIIQTPEDVSKIEENLKETLAELNQLNQARSAYKVRTSKVALWTALFIGLLISGVGIRSLETLVSFKSLAAIKDQQPNVYFYDGQRYIFRILDTLLTGGLIAGGSDGIHKLTQVFTAFLEVTRNKIRDNPN